MTPNLLHKIHDKIDDRLVGLIGTVLSENEERTRAAITAAVPTLLRGIMGIAVTDQGTQMVERELDPFDDDIIHEYGKQLEFDKSRQLIEDGSQMVQAFFGNGTVRTMSVISRESGLGATKCRSLTGMLMPLVLGVLGEHRKTKNLDTPSFQRLLENQADCVARKVPDGVCAALNLPKLEKTTFYPPQRSRPTLSPYRPATQNVHTQTSSVNLNVSHQPHAISTQNSVLPLANTQISSSPSVVADMHTNDRKMASDAHSEGGLEWLWGVVLPAVILLSLLGWLFSRSWDDKTSRDIQAITATDQQEKQSDRVAASLRWDDDAPPNDVPSTGSNQTQLNRFDTSALFDEEIPAIAPAFDEDESDGDEQKQQEIHEDVNDN